jgi:WD40 repeat protein
VIDLPGGQSQVTAAARSFDGSWVAATDAEGTIRIWRLSTGELVAMMRVEHRLNCCAWTPDDAAVIVGGDGGLYRFGFRQP